MIENKPCNAQVKISTSGPRLVKDRNKAGEWANFRTFEIACTQCNFEMTGKTGAVAYDQEESVKSADRFVRNTVSALFPRAQNMPEIEG